MINEPYERSKKIQNTKWINVAFLDDKTTLILCWSNVEILSNLNRRSVINHDYTIHRRLFANVEPTFLERHENNVDNFLIALLTYQPIVQLNFDVLTACLPTAFT